MIRTNFTVMGEPMGKPRMTQSDKWKNRECVTEYWEWADAIRQACGVSDRENKLDGNNFIGMHVYAHCGIPKSYSQKKREALQGTPCTSKPDSDNIIKAIADSLFANDERLFIMQCVKFWAYDDEQPRVDVFLITKTGEVS